MQAAEFMTTPVITVSPDDHIKDAARLLVDGGVSSAPVVDGQHLLVGMVAEVDLLQGRMEPDPRAHMIDHGLDRERPPTRVRDVMTAVVVVLGPSDDEREFVRLMREQRIRSIPVVESGRVVGIVSRRDLLRTLAREDAEIADDIDGRLREYAGGTDTWTATVTDGRVVLSGVGSAEEQRVAILLARTVPGVARVEVRPQRAEPPALDRGGLRVLPFDDCMQRLRDLRVGRLAFHADGDLVLLPITYAVDGMTIVFRTAPGSKLTAAEHAAVVAFEIDAYDATRHLGWSVLVRGRLETVYDEAEIGQLEALGLVPWADRVPRALWVRLHPLDVSGREIVHGPPLP